MNEAHITAHFFNSFLSSRSSCAFSLNKAFGGCIRCLKQALIILLQGQKNDSALFFFLPSKGAWLFYGDSPHEIKLSMDKKRLIILCSHCKRLLYFCDMLKWLNLNLESISLGGHFSLKLLFILDSTFAVFYPYVVMIYIFRKI